MQTIPSSACFPSAPHTPALTVALTEHPSEAVRGEAGQGHDFISSEERQNTTKEAMSVNITHKPPSLSSSNSSISSIYHCQNSLGSTILIATYTFILTLFILPLCILVLYIGFQRQRHQHSVPAGKTTSHTDVITYHTVTVDLFAVFGSVLYIWGAYSYINPVLMLGVFLYCIVFPGHTLLHCLICVEHYLAVVHPITYQRLKQTLGVRFRNISLGCVWLLSLGWIGVTMKHLPDFPVIPLLCLLGMSVTVVLFFFFSILKVLTHPGPGGGPRERVDHAKQRALHIITVIVGVLLLRFVSLLLTVSLYDLSSNLDHQCILLDCGLLLALPSSLVQPLLFLHRAGKLTCCRQSVESGWGGGGGGEPRQLTLVNCRPPRCDTDRRT
ncbi:uncharacterized protein [Paralichthys olivaceus]|uniref:uncharacterized protein n=1 Tax=Paralichthys olivaceus TaxID=8255 RepID=UPI003752AB84